MLNGGRADEAGFTLIELVIVTAIMAIVLSIAGTSLFSMSMGAKRGDSLVKEEQGATLAVNVLAKDIRSAHTLAYLGGAPSPNQLVLLVNSPGARVDNVQYCQTSSANPDYTPVPYQLVEWTYAASTATITRSVLNCGTAGNPVLGTTWRIGPIGTAAQQLSVVNSSSSTAVFRYYNQYGTDISTALPGAIASCATRVAVDLIVASKIGGTASVEEKQSAAITDQLDILSQPGNGQC
jgi:prepilin-type N-terminal cleavage/methylation domain-containing protein